MTSYELWLIFGVPFLITGVLSIGVLKSSGNRSILILAASCYVVFVVFGPIWLCFRYFDAADAWYGLAVSLAFRALELTVFQVGKIFKTAWESGK